MRTGKVLCPKTDDLVVWRRRAQKAAGKDLPACLPEVLGQEGVEDRVDARVPVRQAMGDDAEGKGGIVQWEGTKFHPHGDDVVRQPAEGEGSDEQKDCLSRLQPQDTGGGKMRNISSRTLKLQQHLPGFPTGGDPSGSLQDFHKFEQTSTLLFSYKS